jgi:gliding motility-associated-like protein
MQMRFEASQKGLAEYSWTIKVNGSTLFSQVSSADFLDFDFNRTAIQQDVEVQLQTTNFATCQGNVESDDFIVPVADNITVSFTATPLTQTWPNATVTITNNTTPGTWQYLWDFGDGITSNAINPGSHTYSTWGTYPITVTVTNGACIGTQTNSITINPIPPTLDFTYNPASGCAPLTVQFTNTSVNANPTSFQWDFGPGEVPSAAINPVHTFVTPGIYSITLTASDNGGGTLSVTKNQIIEVFESPVAQFNIKPTQVSAPGDVYTDNRSFGATSYLWDFGDGTTSTLFEPIHKYNSAGTFDIMLVATNAGGCRDTALIESAVAVIEGAKLLIPNAFSPGRDGPGSGDGKNDTFFPLMRGVVEFQMTVFNRWGELLFETRDAEDGWNGYYKGKLCQQDVYVYKIVAKYENGDTITKVGDIHLIR